MKMDEPDSPTKTNEKATFITGTNGEVKEEKKDKIMPEKLEFEFMSNIAEFEKDDVHMVNRWKAHQDLINHITYVPDLKVIATCSFDCNVSMWDRKTSIIEKEDRIVRTNKRVGSLLLGTGHAQQSEQTEAERRRYANARKIKIDKLPKLV